MKPINQKSWNGTPCVEWHGAAASSGHGIANCGPDFPHMHAARIMWNLAWGWLFGLLPSHLCVCHHCDNPLCFRLDHLFIGTKGDNSRDMSAKGRSTQGEKQPNHKLTEVDVLSIRADDRPYVEIASIYGVCPSSISYIKSRKRWAHL